MKKALSMILPCVLTLSIAATPVLAADSNPTCKAPRTFGNNAQIVQALSKCSGQRSQANNRTDINSLISQLFSGQNGYKLSTPFNWGEVTCKNNSSSSAGKNSTCSSTGSTCTNGTTCKTTDCTDGKTCTNGTTCKTTDCTNGKTCPSSNSSSSSSSSSSSEAADTSSSSSSEATNTSSSSSSEAANTSSSSAADVTTGSYREFQKRVVELVNEARAQNGLGALTENAELDKIATLKSQDMADLNYFSHTSPTYGSPFDMLSQFGITYRAAGENIAMGQPTPEAVMNAWMNSQGHRENILNANYDKIGVGIVKNANGQYIWTQTFLK
ncbi:CAP domain-containing protein [Oscillospiraceae bacterium PP1C4]